MQQFNVGNIGATNHLADAGMAWVVDNGDLVGEWLLVREPDQIDNGCAALVV